MLKRYHAPLLLVCAVSAVAQTLTVSPTSFEIVQESSPTTSLTVNYSGATVQPVSVSVTLLRAASSTWLTVSGNTNNLPASGQVVLVVNWAKLPPTASTGPDVANNGDYVALVRLKSGSKTAQVTVLVHKFPNSSLLATPASRAFKYPSDVAPKDVSMLAVQIDPDGAPPPRLNCVASVQTDNPDGVWLTIDPPALTTTAPERIGAFNIRLTSQAQSLSAGLHSSYVAIQNRDKPSDIVYIVVDVDVTPPPPVTISGTIRDSTNQPLGGVTVTFSNVASVVTDSTGKYSQQVPGGYTGTATPARSGYSFNPSSRAYTNLTATSSGNDYVATRLPTTVTISGTVLTSQNQPLNGITMIAGAARTTTDASGNYVLQVSSGFSGTVVPSFSNYTFTPSSRLYSNLIANIAGENYTGAPPAPVVISGTVLNSQNQPLSGVTLTGGATRATTNGNGNYVLQVPFGFSGTVAPSFSNYSFSPSSRVYSNLIVSTAGEDYTGTPPAPVTISGSVLTQQGQPLAGVSIVFGNQGPTVTTAGNGTYSASVPTTYSGNAVPSLTGYTFMPASRTYVAPAANVSSENYTAVAVPAVTYMLSGRVTTSQGQAVADVSVSFGNGQTVMTDSAGGYSGRVSANYSGTVTPTRSGFIFQPANRAFTNVNSDQSGANFTAVPQTNNAPAITQVQNAAGFQSTIQQQSWVAISGTNLSATTRQWTDADFVGGKLPTRLSNVSVSVNGKAAAVYYISPTQINVWTPPDTATGTVLVTVTSSGTSSSPFAAQMQQFSPAVFEWGNRYAVATSGANYLGPPGVLGPTITTTPAKPGDIVSLWGTGFGPVDPAPPADTAVPRSPVYAIRTAPRIRVGGLAADYLAGALAADSVGLYVINVRLPANLPDGDQKLEIDFSGVTGPDGVFLNIRR